MITCDPARALRSLENPNPMVVTVKKKLRRLHHLLVNSRYALEKTSRAVNSSWLGDLLFMLSCRRIIMLNELDRELGQLHVPTRAGEEGTNHFQHFPASGAGPQRYVQVCEAEEAYLQRELESLNMEPGLHGHTRDAIAALLQETRANLKDIMFLRENHPALQN